MRLQKRISRLFGDALLAVQAFDSGFDILDLLLRLLQLGKFVFELWSDFGQHGLASLGVGLAILQQHFNLRAARKGLLELLVLGVLAQSDALQRRLERRERVFALLNVVWLGHQARVQLLLSIALIIAYHLHLGQLFVGLGELLVVQRVLECAANSCPAARTRSTPPFLLELVETLVNDVQNFLDVILLARRFLHDAKRLGAPLFVHRTARHLFEQVQAVRVLHHRL